MTRTPFTRLFIALAIAASLHRAAAQGTAFTYQGRLNDGGAPATGIYDLRFTIYDSLSGGSVVAGPLTNSAVGVTNGLFTTTLDFGAGVWNGRTNWLQIGVETNGGGGFTTLTPRQELTPVPYSIFAGSAGGVSGLVVQQNTNGSPNLIGGSAANYVAGGVIGATIGGGGTTNFNLSGFGAGAYSNRVTSYFGTVGGGAGNTAGDQATVGGGALNTATGQNGTVAGGWANTASGEFAAVGGGSNNHSVGTATEVGSGELNTASGTEATVAGGFGNAASGAGSFIGGGGSDGTTLMGNQVQADAATIGGGLGNIIVSGDNYGVIGGGSNNVIQMDSPQSSIGGGSMNQIQSTNPACAIGGGFDNLIQPLAGSSTISGGEGNAIDDTDPAYNGGEGSAIGGGIGNHTDGNFATISGGSDNWAPGIGATAGGGIDNNAAAYCATVAGGISNSASGLGSFIGGGGSDGGLTTRIGNTAGGNFATIAGGYSQTANGAFATIPGGYKNMAAGAGSFAAGRQAQAMSDGDFVWADDSQNAPFTSSDTNQFLIRAQGGVGINTASPQKDLSVNAGMNIDQANGNGGTVSSNALTFGSDSGEGIASKRTGGADQFDLEFYTGFANRMTILQNGEVGINTSAPAGTLTVNTGAGTLTVRNESGLVPGLVAADSGPYSGYLRFRNRLEIWPNDAATASGYLDVRGTNGAPTIALDGQSGTITCVTLNQTSDRNAKTNFRPVNPDAVLAKVLALPISEWNFKTDPANLKHLGPMAQDFHAAFGLNGSDNKHITTVDEGGVALAAVQGLNQKVDGDVVALRRELKHSNAENAQLKAELDSLKQLVNELNQKLNGGAR